MPRRKGAVDQATWRALSLACATREKFRCALCGQRPPRGLQAHHTVARSAGGIDSLENLVGLCPLCHEFVQPRWRNYVRLFADYVAGRAARAAGG